MCGRTEAIETLPRASASSRAFTSQRCVAAQRPLKRRLVVDVRLLEHLVATMCGRTDALGQALGLPTTMALYSFIGVAVTSATIVIHGKAEWDPVVLLARFDSPVLHVV